MTSESNTKMAGVVALSKTSSSLVSVTAGCKDETPAYEHELEDYDNAGLPAKYRGTANDQHDMSILGKKQVLRVWPSKTLSFAQVADV